MTHLHGERFLQPTEFEAESLPSCGMRPIWPIDKKMLALRVFVLPVYGVEQLLSRTRCVEVTIA